VAKAAPQKRILLLTYNARLKLETRERVKRCGLERTLEVHSYHSMGVKYYDTSCFQTEGISRVLRQRTPPRTPLPHFDLVIIDEAQDQTKTLYDFVQKLLSDLPGPYPQLMVVGDENQCIYSFMDADAR